MRSMPRARMAYARNLPKRFRVKSDTRSGESAGSALSAGSPTTMSSAAARRTQGSRIRISSLGREQPRRPALDEADHQDQDEHLAEHRPQRRLDHLVEPADARRGQDAAEELADAPGH